MSKREADIAALQDLGESGYFGPNSACWEVYKESIFLFGGVRALLLQVAHPAIADGVARFSNFEKDAFGRAFRTFLAMGTLYFGNAAQARNVGERLYKIHGSITGTYLTQEGNPDTERHYSANDPDLLLWVHATLIHTSTLVYETMLGPMSTDLRNRFYQENKVAAILMGIPPDTYPIDYEAFSRYFESVLSDGTLYVSDYGFKTGKAIIDHESSPTRIVKYLAAGMLPVHLCKSWGVAKTEDSEIRVSKTLKRIGLFYRILPPFIKYAPAYHQARYRVAKALGQKPPLAGRFWWWVAQKVKRFPLTIPVAC